MATTAARRDIPAPATDSGIDLDSVGIRLRELRLRHGWTRGDVERVSNGRWSATALGTYERGQRTLTAVTLCALADFYRVPMTDLLGAHPALDGAVPIEQPLVIDSVRLVESGRRPTLVHFVAGVRQARSAPPSRLLKLRSRDLQRLAAIHGLAPKDFLRQLHAEEILVSRLH